VEGIRMQWFKRQSRLAKTIILVGVPLLLLCLCAGLASVVSPKLKGTPTVVAGELLAETPIPTHTPYFTYTPYPTYTLLPVPTETPTPTDTPVPPTSTQEPTTTPTPIIYVVQAGDTLSAIAKQYGVTVETLQEANAISDPRRLQIGQELIIPKGGTTVPRDTATEVKPTPTSTPVRVQARVMRVIDGDTIEVSMGSKLYKVRYIGIDAPETKHPEEPVEWMGQEAAARNGELVRGKVVELEKDVSETDQYSRLLRYVWVGDLMVNAELVRLGYATVSTYPPDVKYKGLFLRLQEEARKAGLGLWGPTPVPPTPVPECPAAAYFPANLCEGCPAYIASYKREPFHYPWCQWAQKISPANLQCFYSREEAIAAGHRPCKVCNP
jgi:micrococcal nuclease